MGLHQLYDCFLERLSLIDGKYFFPWSLTSPSLFILGLILAEIPRLLVFEAYVARQTEKVRLHKWFKDIDSRLLPKAELLAFGAILALLLSSYLRLSWLSGIPDLAGLALSL